MLLPVLVLAQENKAADRIKGVWYNGEKTSKIEIFKTTKGDYAGRIIWLKEPNDEAGNPKTDKKNPEKSLRSRPTLGLIILKGLEYKGNSKWEDGEIYDPKNGKTYSCKAEMTDVNTLQFRGFIKVSLLGRTDTWIRTTK